MDTSASSHSGKSPDWGELLHWYLLVVLLLFSQLVILTLFALFGIRATAGLFTKFIEFAYVRPVVWLVPVLFGDENHLGNVPLGLGMLLLVVIIYAFLGGTVVYLIHRLSHGKRMLSFFCFALGLLLFAACGKSGPEAPESSEGKADSVVFTMKDGVELEMIRVQPGTYTVGLPRADHLWRPDIDWREVTVSAPYWLGKYEVTQEQWESVMSGEKRPDGFDLSNPSLYKGEKRPVDAVNRNDVNRFIEKLNALCADKLPDGYRFDLPDPLRWEIACRAGTTTRMPWGDDSKPEAANLIAMGELENSIDDLSEDVTFTNAAKTLFSAVKVGIGSRNRHAFRKTSEIGQYPPNAWGFCDMIGNVAELCRERHTYSGGYGGPMQNAAEVTGELPPGNDYYERKTDETVTHGGSWWDPDSVISPANSCWHPYYDHAHPEPVYDKVTGHHVVGWKESCIGFRLALVPAGTTEVETVKGGMPVHAAGQRTREKTLEQNAGSGGREVFGYPVNETSQNGGQQ